MQKILVLFAFVCLTLPALTAQNTRRVEVFFMNVHTKTDLMNIQAELGAQKITLEYTHMKFDADGHLQELGFTVDCQDGFKGSAKTDQAPADQSFGFYRDYRPGAAQPFGAGAVSKE
ncbi:MAG: hypothetical protein IPH12_15230 [Saprospirales bacterium]|nr:hypothetical protein [Saprospirales bacterium]MBK8923536.1 hypothetical protein [Saprospirales bacterium]